MLFSCLSVRQSSEESVIIIVVVVVAAAAPRAVSSSSVACRGKDKVFTPPWHIHSNCFVFRGCACCLFVCLKRWQQRGSDWQYVQTAAVPHTHKKSFYQHSFHPAVAVPLSSPIPKMQQAPSPAPSPAPPPLN